MCLPKAKAKAQWRIWSMGAVRNNWRSRCQCANSCAFLGAVSNRERQSGRSLLLGTMAWFAGESIEHCTTSPEQSSTVQAPPPKTAKKDTGSYVFPDSFGEKEVQTSFYEVGCFDPTLLSLDQSSSWEEKRLTKVSRWALWSSQGRKRKGVEKRREKKFGKDTAKGSIILWPAGSNDAITTTSSAASLWLLHCISIMCPWRANQVQVQRRLGKRLVGRWAVYRN